MSWLFSQALVEEYSAATYSDGGQLLLSSGMPMPQAFSLQDKTAAYSSLSRFGMTCKPLTEDHGLGLLMWYLEASLARTLARKGKEKESTANDQECGSTWRASLARYDPATHTLKTVQNSLIPGLIESSVTLPKWGSMLNGVLYLRRHSGRLTSEIESGLLPTPRVSRGFTNPTEGKKRNDCLTTKILGKPILGMRPNPRYVEWMMGFPIGWTELRGLETPRFREWQQQHGGFSANET